MADILIQLTEIQRKWSYLEPLFIGSDEVRKELPDDAKRFEAIDSTVKAILAEAHKTGNMKEALTKDGLMKQMEQLQSELDRCEKALADFLDGKRRQFPRFYFVSKTDLLDILSNGSNPRKIMQHITKIMLATDSLTLEGGEAPGWQGAKSEHIGNMRTMSNAARRDASPAECKRTSETRHYWKSAFFHSCQADLRYPFEKGGPAWLMVGPNSSR